MMSKLFDKRENLSFSNSLKSDKARYSIQFQLKF